MKLKHTTLLVMLLAVASLATTALVAMNVLARRASARRDPGKLLEPGLALPEFTLTERSGRPLGSADLRGRVWVADFIFTRCPGICPRMTGRMGELQAHLATVAGGAEVRLLSISVDPEHDTPARLASYAGRHGADPERWLFVTGDRDVIWRLCRDGFRQTVEENPADAATPILHTPHFILVDRRMAIRGFYNSLVPAEMEQLRDDLAVVVQERDEATEPRSDEGADKGAAAAGPAPSPGRRFVAPSLRRSVALPPWISPSSPTSTPV